MLSICFRVLAITTVLTQLIIYWKNARTKSSTECTGPKISLTNNNSKFAVEQFFKAFTNKSFN